IMQHGFVDLVITGADRVTGTGDVANKIGTYLKALAAMDNGIPFYVALPSSTFDASLKDGIREIPIEQRGSDELTHVEGLTQAGQIETLRIIPAQSEVANYGFDVTPARLITALITEKGICPANKEAIFTLHPDLDAETYLE
ncbi:MAG: S-methyl-5-thioribose-1-phosphate isomerase, partial [Verrucomicrobia bacterium]|nr:S-methyl-5-thioribose-1-phosphate isomerase [Verrucomicrobiota bacterium]